MQTSKLVISNKYFFDTFQSRIDIRENCYSAAKKPIDADSVSSELTQYKLQQNE
jgi:hypothetical protein